MLNHDQMIIIILTMINVIITILTITINIIRN